MNKKVRIIVYQIMIIISMVMIGISIFFMLSPVKNTSQKAVKKITITDITTTKGICDVIDYNPSNNSTEQIVVNNTKALYDTFTNRRVTSDWNVLLPKLNKDKKSFANYTLRRSGANLKISFIESCYGFKWDSSDGVDFSGDFDADLREMFDLKVKAEWQKGTTNLELKRSDVYVASYQEEIVTDGKYISIYVNNIYLKPSTTKERYYGFTITISNAIPSTLPLADDINQVSNEILNYMLKNIKKQS